MPPPLNVLETAPRQGYTALPGFTSVRMRGGRYLSWPDKVGADIPLALPRQIGVQNKADCEKIQYRTLPIP